MKDHDSSAAWLSPMALWQHYWEPWASWQQFVMRQWMSGMPLLWQQGAASVPADLPAWPNPWAVSGLEAFTKLYGALPRVAAQITPLETTGPLAGAAEAARLSMRIAMPGCLGPAEMLLVEAVVARAPAAEAERLTQASRKLLPKS